MTDGHIFCDKYFEKRESAVREKIGKQLDQLEKEFEQLHSPVMVRLMNAKLEKALTLEELLSFEPSRRQGIVSAVLYNDAFWRLEAARIMLTVGMFNVCYSNLRSCLETIVTAHIIENLDAEAIKFIKQKAIVPAKIATFIPDKYNEAIIGMKKTLGNWGVHCSINGTQIGLAFGPSTSDKMLSKTSTQRKEALNEDFANVAITCINVMNDVFLLFMFLIHKGTTYRK